MAENSAIEWTHHTFNPWRGCTKVSAGCANCYAETLSGRNPKTLGVWGPNGTRVVAAESAWKEPLKWDRRAKAAGERHRVFCASLADVFEDWAGPMTDSKGRTVLRGDWQECLWDADEPLTMDYFRFELFNLIRRTPNLDWLLLTKRPQNIEPMTREFLGAWKIDHMPNVWLGASVENQAAADERIPHLLRTPAAVRFLSCEPLLGPVGLARVGKEGRGDDINALIGSITRYQYKARNDSECSMGVSCQVHPPETGKVDWVIVGGESGHGARPMHPDWARSLRDQCQAAGVAFFFKQWGEYVEWDGSQSPSPACRSEDGRTPYVRIGKKAAGRLLDGRTWDEFPKAVPA